MAGQQTTVPLALLACHTALAPTTAAAGNTHRGPASKKNGDEQQKVPPPRNGRRNWGCVVGVRD